MTEPTQQEKSVLAAVFAKMDVIAMAAATGTVFAFGLFLATAILLLQNVPADYPVGPHLETLTDYLPGYSVSWGGSVIGAFYGLLMGSLLGFLMAAIWNFTHFLALAALLLRTTLMAD